eukprot:1671782-Amphidinium_carterae.1
MLAAIWTCTSLGCNEYVDPCGDVLLLCFGRVGTAIATATKAETELKGCMRGVRRQAISNDDHIHANSANGHRVSCRCTGNVSHSKRCGLQVAVEENQIATHMVACSRAPLLIGFMSTDEALRLYGLYKQVTCRLLSAERGITSSLREEMYTARQT